MRVTLYGNFNHEFAWNSRSSVARVRLDEASEITGADGESLNRKAWIGLERNP